MSVQVCVCVCDSVCLGDSVCARVYARRHVHACASVHACIHACMNMCRRPVLASSTGSTKVAAQWQHAYLQVTHLPVQVVHLLTAFLQDGAFPEHSRMLLHGLRATEKHGVRRAGILSTMITQTSCKRLNSEVACEAN